MPHIQAPALSLSSGGWEPSPLCSAAPTVPFVPLSLPHFLPQDLLSLCSCFSCSAFMLSLLPSLPFCSSVSLFLSLSAPSHLSDFPSPASVLLSRTVWKVEKPSWGWEDSCSRGRDGPGLIIMVCQVPSSSESRRKGAAEPFRMCVS